MYALDEYGKTFEENVLHCYDSATKNCIRITEDIHMVLSMLESFRDEPTLRALKAILNTALDHCSKNIQNYYGLMEDQP